MAVECVFFLFWVCIYGCDRYILQGIVFAKDLCGVRPVLSLMTVRMWSRGCGV